MSEQTDNKLCEEQKLYSDDYISKGQLDKINKQSKIHIMVRHEFMEHSWITFILFFSAAHECHTICMRPLRGEIVPRLAH